jgi:hypothetical protein
MMYAPACCSCSSSRSAAHDFHGVVGEDYERIELWVLVYALQYAVPFTCTSAWVLQLQLLIMKVMGSG